MGMRHGSGLLSANQLSDLRCARLEEQAHCRSGPGATEGGDDVGTGGAVWHEERRGVEFISRVGGSTQLKGGNDQRRADDTAAGRQVEPEGDAASWGGQLVLGRSVSSGGCQELRASVGMTGAKVGRAASAPPTPLRLPAGQGSGALGGRCAKCGDDQANCRLALV